VKRPFPVFASTKTYTCTTGQLAAGDLDELAAGDETLYRVPAGSVSVISHARRFMTIPGLPDSCAPPEESPGSVVGVDVLPYVAGIETSTSVCVLGSEAIAGLVIDAAALCAFTAGMTDGGGGWVVKLFPAGLKHSDNGDVAVEAVVVVVSVDVSALAPRVGVPPVSRTAVVVTAATATTTRHGIL